MAVIVRPVSLGRRWRKAAWPDGTGIYVAKHLCDLAGYIGGFRDGFLRKYDWAAMSFGPAGSEPTDQTTPLLCAAAASRFRCRTNQWFPDKKLTPDCGMRI